MKEKIYLYDNITTVIELLQLLKDAVDTHSTDDCLWVIDETVRNLNSISKQLGDRCYATASTETL